jgi:hypothetical protein
MALQQRSEEGNVGMTEILFDKASEAALTFNKRNQDRKDIMMQAKRVLENNCYHDGEIHFTQAGFVEYDRAFT